MPARLPVVLSPSRTETSAACHRKHVGADVLDRHMGKKHGANFGTAVHHVIGSYYETCTDDGRDGDINLAAEQATSSWVETRPEGDNNSHAMLAEIMGWYLPRASTGSLLAPETLPGSWKLAVLQGTRMVEQRIVIPVEGFELSFQLDRMLTNGDGDYAIVDTKTAAAITNKWRLQWPISIQQRLYTWATKEWMKRNGIRYNMFYGVIEGIHKRKPIEITPIVLPQWTDGELDEAMRLWKANAAKDLDIIEAGLGRAIELHGEGFSDTQFRNALEDIAFTHTEFNYEDCWRYGKCPYFDICRAPPEIRGDMIKEFYIEEVKGY